MLGLFVSASNQYLFLFFPLSVGGNQQSGALRTEKILGIFELLAVDDQVAAACAVRKHERGLGRILGQGHERERVCGRVAHLVLAEQVHFGVGIVAVASRAVLRAVAEQARRDAWIEPEVDDERLPYRNGRTPDEGVGRRHVGLHRQLAPTTVAGERLGHGVVGTDAPCDLERDVRGSARIAPAQAEVLGLASSNGSIHAPARRIAGVGRAVIVVVARLRRRPGHTSFALAIVTSRALVTVGARCPDRQVDVRATRHRMAGVGRALVGVIARLRSASLTHAVLADLASVADVVVRAGCDVDHEQTALHRIADVRRARVGIRAVFGLGARDLWGALAHAVLADVVERVRLRVITSALALRHVQALPVRTAAGIRRAGVVVVTPLCGAGLASAVQALVVQRARVPVGAAEVVGIAHLATPLDADLVGARIPRSALGVRLAQLLTLHLAERVDAGAGQPCGARTGEIGVDADLGLRVALVERARLVVVAVRVAHAARQVAAGLLRESAGAGLGVARVVGARVPIAAHLGHIDTPLGAVAVVVGARVAVAHAALRGEDAVARGGVALFVGARVAVKAPRPVDVIRAVPVGAEIAFGTGVVVVAGRTVRHEHAPTRSRARIVGALVIVGAVGLRGAHALAEVHVAGVDGTGVLVVAELGHVRDQLVDTGAGGKTACVVGAEIAVVAGEQLVLAVALVGSVARVDRALVVVGARVRRVLALAGQGVTRVDRALRTVVTLRVLRAVRAHAGDCDNAGGLLEALGHEPGADHDLVLAAEERVARVRGARILVVAVGRSADALAADAGVVLGALVLVVAHVRVVHDRDALAEVDVAHVHEARFVVEHRAIAVGRAGRLGLHDALAGLTGLDRGIVAVVADRPALDRRVLAPARGIAEVGGADVVVVAGARWILAHPVHAHFERAVRIVVGAVDRGLAGALGGHARVD